MLAAGGDSGSVGRMKHPVVTFFEQFPDLLQGAGNPAKVAQVPSGSAASGAIETIIIVDGDSPPVEDGGCEQKGADGGRLQAPIQPKVAALGRAMPPAAAAKAGASPASCAVGGATSGVVQAAAAPKAGGARSAAAAPGLRRRRTWPFTEMERRRATPLLAKLMEAANYKSNVTGGAAGFRQLIQEARSLAPLDKRATLTDVLQSFKPKKPSVHRSRLGEIIAEWEAEPGVQPGDVCWV